MRAIVVSLIVGIALVLALAAARSSPQAPASRPATAVQVAGVGLEARTFDLDALAKLPRTALEVRDKEGAPMKYEGVRVGDVLAAAGLRFGQNLRGPRLADYLLVEATDAYRVVFALTEFDPEFSDRVVLLADRCNGKPIEGRDGPLRIIVSDERKHARWVRNVARLTIHSAPADK